MEKAYKITGLKFESQYMIITIDNLNYRFKLSEISERLSMASEIERNDFRISPSGYGIHWNLIDEDLSINGLLQSQKKHHPSQQRT